MSATDFNRVAPVAPRPVRRAIALGGGDRAALYIIAGSTLFTMLYVGRFLFLPIVIAGLVAIIFGPIVRRLGRIGVPSPLSAMVIMLVLVLGMGGIVLGLSEPLSQWINDAPRISAELRERLDVLRRPFEAVTRASTEVEKLANPEGTTPAVEIRQPSLIWRLANVSLPVAGAAVVTFALALFLLSYADIFYEKTLRILPRLSDKKRAYTIIREVEDHLSRYLFTVTIINCVLGAAIGAAMYALGMPSPILWGVAAALLNFLPYVGAVIGVVLVGIVSIISFDSLGEAAVPPLVFLLFTAIEGQFITPAAVGRRLQLNPVVILIAIALWGFLWGFLGVLVTVPLLVVFKVFCDHVESLGRIGEFVSARTPQAE